MRPLVALLFCLSGAMASAQVRSGAFSLFPNPSFDRSATHLIGVGNISGTNDPTDTLDWYQSSWLYWPGTLNSTLSYRTMVVNRYNAWWSLVPQGTALTSATYPDFNSGTPLLIPNNRTFYLGARFTVSQPLNGMSEPWVDVDCAYGWVGLRSVGGHLELVSSALAPGSSGIIVGTLNVVPEPSALSLAFLSLGALFFRSGQSRSGRWKAGSLALADAERT